MSIFLQTNRKMTETIDDFDHICPKNLQFYEKFFLKGGYLFQNSPQNRVLKTSISTLLAELAYTYLLLRHVQLFIFPSVARVNQLCLGLTLLLQCCILKVGLDSRLPVLFDRFILFWRAANQIAFPSVLFSICEKRSIVRSIM